MLTAAPMHAVRLLKNQQLQTRTTAGLDTVFPGDMSNEPMHASLFDHPGKAAIAVVAMSVNQSQSRTNHSPSMPRANA